MLQLLPHDIPEEDDFTEPLPVPAFATKRLAAVASTGCAAMITTKQLTTAVAVRAIHFFTDTFISFDSYCDLEKLTKIKKGFQQARRILDRKHFARLLVCQSIRNRHAN